MHNSAGSQQSIIAEIYCVLSLKNVFGKYANLMSELGHSRYELHHKTVIFRIIVVE